MRNNSNQGQDYNTLIEKVRQSRISLNSSENATSSSSAAANSGVVQMFTSTAAAIGTTLAELVGSRPSSRSNSPAISNNVLEFQNDEVRQTVGEIVNKLLIIAEGYNSTSPIADLRNMLGYKEEGDVFQMNMADNFHSPEIRNKRDAFRIIIQNLDLIDRELFQDDTARDRLRNILTTKTNSTEALDPTDLGKLYLRTVKDEVDVGQIPENHRKQIVKDNNDLLKRENDLSKLSNDLSQYQSLANEFIEESFKAFFQFEDIASEESKSGRVKRTHETFAKNLSSVMAKIVAENEGETNQSEAEIIRRYSGIPIETIAAKIESKLPEIEERLKITYTVLAKEKKREENPDQEELTAEEKQKTEEEAKEAAQRFIEREFNFHNQLKKLIENHNRPQIARQNSSNTAAAISDSQPPEPLTIEKLAIEVLKKTNELYKEEATKILSKLLQGGDIEEYKDSSPIIQKHYRELQEVVSKIKNNADKKGLETSIFGSREQLFAKLISFVSEVQIDKENSQIPIMEVTPIGQPNFMAEKQKSKQVVYDTAIERFAKSRLLNVLKEEFLEFGKITKGVKDTEPAESIFYSDEEKNHHLRILKRFLKDYYYEGSEVRIKLDKDLENLDQNSPKLDKDLQRLAADNIGNYELLNRKVDSLISVRQGEQEEQGEDLTFETVVKSMKAFNRFSYDYRPIRDDEDQFYVRPRFVYQNSSLIRENIKNHAQIRLETPLSSEIEVQTDSLDPATIGRAAEQRNPDQQPRDQQNVNLNLDALAQPIANLNTTLEAINQNLQNPNHQNNDQLIGRIENLEQNLNLQVQALTTSIQDLSRNQPNRQVNDPDILVALQQAIQALTQNNQRQNNPEHQLQDNAQVMAGINALTTAINALQGRVDALQQQNNGRAEAPANPELVQALNAINTTLQLFQRQNARDQLPRDEAAAVVPPPLPQEANNGINQQIQDLEREIRQLRNSVGNPAGQGIDATGLFAIQQPVRNNNDAAVNQEIGGQLQQLQNLLGNPAAEGREPTGIYAIQQRVEEFNRRFEGIQEVLNGNGEQNLGLAGRVTELGDQLRVVQENLAGVNDVIREQVAQLGDQLGDQLRGMMGTPRIEGDAAADPTGVYLAIDQQRQEILVQLEEAVGEDGLGGQIARLVQNTQDLANQIQELANRDREAHERLQDQLEEVRNGQQNNVNQNPNQNPDDDLIAAPRIVSKETLQTMPEMSRILFPAIVGGSTGFELTQAGPVAIYKKSEMLKLQDHINAATQAYNDNNRQDFVSSTGHNQSSLVSVVKIVDDNQPNRAQYRILSLSKLGLSQTFLTQEEYEKFALEKVTLTNQKTKEAITENLRDGKPVDLRKILEKGVNQNDRLNSNERETQHRLINDAMSKHYEELKQEAEKQVDKSLSERYQSLIDLVQNDDLKTNLTAALRRDDFAKVRSELLDPQQERVIKESLFSPANRRQAGDLWSNIAKIRNGKPNNEVDAYGEVEGLIFGGQGNLLDTFNLLGEGKYSEFLDDYKYVNPGLIPFQEELSLGNAKIRLKFAREASKIGVIRSDFGDRFLESVFGEDLLQNNPDQLLNLDLRANVGLRNSLTDLTNKLFKGNNLQTLEEEVRNSGGTVYEWREDFDRKFNIRNALSSANTIGDLLEATRDLRAYANADPVKIGAIKTFFGQIVDDSSIADAANKNLVKNTFFNALDTGDPLDPLDAELTGTQLNEKNKVFLQGDQGVKSLIELPEFGLRDKIKRDLEVGRGSDLKKIIHFLYAKENSNLVNQEVADDFLCEVLHAKEALPRDLDELAKPIHLTDANLNLIAEDTAENAEIRKQIKNLVEDRSFKDLFDLLNDQLQKPEAERFADGATNENIVSFLTALKSSLLENGFINQQQSDGIVFENAGVVNYQALLDFKEICERLQKEAEDADLPNKNKELRRIVTKKAAAFIEEDQAFTNARENEEQPGARNTTVASLIETLNGDEQNPKQTIAALVSHIFGGNGEDTVDRRKHHSLFDPKEGIELVGKILDQYRVAPDLKQGIKRDLTAKEYSRALEKISTISEDIARGDGAIVPDYSKLICDVRTRAMNRLQDGDYTGLYEILFADENKTIVDKEAAAGFFKNIFVKAQEIAKQNVDPANAAQNALANENLAEIRSLEQYFEKIPLITNFINSPVVQAQEVRLAIQTSVAPNGKKTLGFPVSNGIFESLELRRDIVEKLNNGQYEEVNQVIDNLRNSRLIAGSGDIIEKQIKIERSSAVEFMAEFNAHNYPEILAAFKAEQEKVAERIDGYRDLASNRYSQTQIDGIMRLILQDPNAVGIEPSIAQINEWRNNNSPEQFIEKIFEQNGDPKFPALFRQVNEQGNVVNDNNARDLCNAFRNAAAREDYIVEALRQRGRQDDLLQLDSLNRAIGEIENYKANVLAGNGHNFGLPQEYLGNKQEIKDLLQNNENIAKAVTAAVAPKLARIHSDIYQQERIENSASRSNYSLSLSKEEKAAMALGDKSLVSVLNLEMPVITNNSGFSARKNLRNQFAVAFHGNFGKIHPQTGSDGTEFPNDTAYVPVVGTKDYFVRTRVCTSSNLIHNSETNETFIDVYRNGKIVREPHKIGDVIVDEGAVFRKEPNGEFKDYSLGETNVHKAVNVAAKTTNAFANLVVGVASLGLISPDKRFLDARNNLEKEVSKDMLQIIKQGYKDTQVLAGSISKDGERNYSTLSQGTVKSFASIIDPLKAKKSIVNAISSVFVHKKSLLSDVARFSHEDKEMVFTIDEKGRFSGGEEDKNIKINRVQINENGEYELTTNSNTYSGRSYYHKSASLGLDLLGLDTNGLPAIELLGKVSIIHTKNEGVLEKLCKNSGDIVASDQIFVKHTVNLGQANERQVITALFNDERTGFKDGLDIGKIFGTQITSDELLAKLQKLRLNHVKNSKAAVTVETKAMEFDKTFESNEDGTIWSADLTKAFKAPEKRYKYEAAVSPNKRLQQICRGSDDLKENLLQSYAANYSNTNSGRPIQGDQAEELKRLRVGAAEFKTDSALNEVRRHLLNLNPKRKSTSTPDPVMRPSSCKTLSGEEVKLHVFKKDIFGGRQ